MANKKEYLLAMPPEMFERLDRFAPNRRKAEFIRTALNEKLNRLENQETAIAA